jgi:hypothetical protein
MEEVKGMVAKTILHQLGGASRLRAMMGARNFVLGTNYLAFAIPSNFAKKNINYFRIELQWNDLYKVCFMSYRAGKMKTVAEYSDMYGDSVKPLIEQETGLYLTF